MIAGGESVSALQRLRGAAGRGVRRIGRGLLVFLDLIGLREDRRVDPEAQLARFRLHHTEFRNLLTANHSFLEVLSDLERRRAGEEYFDLAALERRILRASVDVYRMVESLNTISGDRHAALRPVRDRITAEITRHVEEAKKAPPDGWVRDLSDLRASHAGTVGGKMANLGEIRGAVGLPTPDGFAVTTEGYRFLVQHGGLRPVIDTACLTIEEPEDLAPVSEALAARIRGAEVPSELARDILAAHDRLAARLGAAPRLAVRSSALGEDTDLSFAGQFLTVLGVTRDELLSAYLQVVASLFSTEAMHYRFLHRVPSESAAMAAGFLPMIDAVAAGVVCTKDPARPDSGHLLLHAVRGLGVSLVDGRTTPEVVRVTRAGRLAIDSRTPSRQSAGVALGPGVGGTREFAIDPEVAVRPILSDEEVLLLARWGLVLEAHFGCPQDVEWAMGEDRKPVILQSRPLRLASRPATGSPPVPGRRLLVRGGEVGCPGVGTGPAVHMDEDGDLDAFPAGGVLVAPRSSPRFVRLLAKSRAIVTDAGSATGHMASLARELRVPTLLATQTATQAIPPGAVVTVDAGSGYVYEGEVPELAPSPAEERPARMGPGAWLRDTAAFRLLEATAPLILPLHLSDPRARSFVPEGCRTLHDIARFVHEKSYEEMFRMGERLGDLRAASYHLDVFLPIDLYILDLGDGLVPGVRGPRIKPADIASAPLAALLSGMLDKRLQRFGPKPMDLGGLLSVMMRHAMNAPERDRTFRDPSYALVSDRYLNFTARVGYHFGVVDAYCGQTPNKNYINLQFQGGAADLVRRNRRVRAIGEILRRSGFLVKVGGDVVTARVAKLHREETAAKLEMIGRLLQFVRQMDLSMATDEAVGRVVETFLRGDYDLTGLNDAATETTSDGGGCAAPADHVKEGHK